MNEQSANNERPCQLGRSLDWTVNSRRWTSSARRREKKKKKKKKNKKLVTWAPFVWPALDEEDLIRLLPPASSRLSRKPNGPRGTGARLGSRRAFAWKWPKICIRESARLIVQLNLSLSFGRQTTFSSGQSTGGGRAQPHSERVRVRVCVCFMLTTLGWRRSSWSCSTRCARFAAAAADLMLLAAQAGERKNWPNARAPKARPEPAVSCPL